MAAGLAGQVHGWWMEWARKTADHVFACLPTGAAPAADKDIVTPIDNTLYSWAWVNLRAEPWC